MARFKSGDRIRIIGDFSRGTLGTVIGSTQWPKDGTEYFVKRDPAGPTDCLRYHESELELLPPEPVLIPHKWAKEIKAWADGAQIQVSRPISLDEWTDWTDTNDPHWVRTSRYRIKPEPDVVEYGFIVAGSPTMVLHASRHKANYDNIKFTFDGETGKLKAVELLA